MADINIGGFVINFKNTIEKKEFSKTFSCSKDNQNFIAKVRIFLKLFSRN
jgi:hypothetical protein